MKSLTVRAVSLVAFALVGFACGGLPPPEAPERPVTQKCRSGPVDDAAMGLRTAGQAVELGAETGWAGVKNVGRAAGGLVEGGTEGAEREWNEGKEVTRGEAREGRDEVRTEAELPPCPP